MQAKSTRYEPPAINFHLSETPPREPQGGGECTESPALSFGQKTMPFLDQTPHFLGQKPHSSQAKQRIGSTPGICYDSGAHLL
jgi:hypothetical protein